MEVLGPLLISESFKHMQDEHVKANIALAKVNQSRKIIQGCCNKGQRPPLILNSTPLKKRRQDSFFFFFFRDWGKANEKLLKVGGVIDHVCLLIAFLEEK